MSSTIENAIEIRPFQVDVPEEELAELRRRIAATRWPEKETVADQSQGVQLATMQALARYWGTEYDFRRFEARLNALPQFMTEIDGLDIHFIHVRSPHENALPLIITHGWPGSVIEMLNVDRPAHRPDGTRRQRGGRVRCGRSRRCPATGSPGSRRRPAGTPSTSRRLDRADAAPRLHALRRAGRRLGRADHGCDGRQGAAGAARHPLQHARHGPTGRFEDARVLGPATRRRPVCRPRSSRAYEQLSFLYTKGIGYATEMALRPQTLYGLADSPVALAAWMLDHDAQSYEDIARAFVDEHPSATSRETRSSTTSRSPG